MIIIFSVFYFSFIEPLNTYKNRKAMVLVFKTAEHISVCAHGILS